MPGTAPARGLDLLHDLQGEIELEGLPPISGLLGASMPWNPGASMWNMYFFVASTMRIE